MRHSVVPQVSEGLFTPDNDSLPNYGRGRITRYSVSLLPQKVGHVDTSLVVGGQESAALRRAVKALRAEGKGAPWEITVPMIARYDDPARSTPESEPCHSFFSLTSLLLDITRTRSVEPSYPAARSIMTESDMAWDRQLNFRSTCRTAPNFDLRANPLRPLAHA
jgi:hypothetical protein